MAACGFDSVTVDLQHGVQDYMSMVTCFQAMQSHPITPMVRVPWNEAGIIGKVLDAGAYGVICPMINNKAEAEAFVRACKYPPMGARSNGPIRVAMYGSSNTSYQSTANDEVLCLPMIETKDGVDNLEEILNVPGVAGVCGFRFSFLLSCLRNNLNPTLLADIGPSDLGFSYGMKPILDRDEPEILAIYDKILKETKKRGQFAGIHCGTAAYAAKAINMGFRLVSLSSDSGILAVAARGMVNETRSGVKI